MQIILSQQCESLTGSIGRGFGYAIVKRGNRFFAQRGNHNVSVPPDGHWRFILTCAELAQNKLHISDIKVSVGELDQALEEATEGMLQTPWAPINAIVNAEQVLKLKTTLGL